MERSREGFGYDKPLWKQRRGHLLQFPDHKAMEKENSRKNLGKTKEKERAKKSGCHNHANEDKKIYLVKNQQSWHTKVIIHAPDKVISRTLVTLLLD